MFHDIAFMALFEVHINQLFFILILDGGNLSSIVGA